MENSKKILFAFDMDHTILQENSDYVIRDLLTEKSRDEINALSETSVNWAKTMQIVYEKMKEEKIDINQVKKIIEDMPFNPGFPEIFELIRTNKERFESIIISGANTLFIQWLIEHHKLHDVFPKFFSNIAEPHQELLIKITQAHEHECKRCDKSQCKNRIMKEYLKEIQYEEGNYDHVLYIGDGSNDYCAGLVLGENDYLFAREGFSLHKMLYKKDMLKDMKCKVVPWKDGYQVLEVVRGLI